MAKERRIPIAVLSLAGGKSDKGMMKTASNILDSMFRGRGITSQFVQETGIINIYGNITEEDARKAVDKLNTAKALSKGRSRIIMEYHPMPQGTPASAETNPGAQKEFEIIEARHKAEIAQLNAQITDYEKTGHELAAVQSSLDNERKKSTGLELRLTETESSRRSLTAKVDVLGKRNAELEKSAKPANSTYDAMIRYLAQFPEKIELIELEAEELLSGKPLDERHKITLENYVAVGIDPKGKNVEQLDEEAKLLLNPGRTDEHFTALFERDKNQIEDYVAAAKKIEAAERVKQDTIKRFGEEKELVASISETIDKDIAKNRLVMEECRQKYITEKKAALESISNTVRSVSEQEATRRDAIQNIGCSAIPVYIMLKEDESSRVMEIYMPVKESQKSTLRDRVLAMGVMSEKVRNSIDEDDFDAISKQTEPESGLEFYRISLPKSKYSLDKVLGIKGEMERAVSEHYKETGLHRLGIGLEVIFSNTVDARAGLNAESIVQPVQQQNYSVMPRRDGIMAAVLRVLEGQKEPANLTGVIEAASGEYGKKLSIYDVRTALRNLGGKVQVSGRSKATRYSLKEDEGA